MSRPFRLRILAKSKRNRDKYGFTNRALAFVGYYGKSFINLVSDSFYFSAERRGLEIPLLVALISHESLHLAINKFDLKASAKLDNPVPAFKLCAIEKMTDGLGLETA